MNQPFVGTNTVSDWAWALGILLFSFLFRVLFGKLFTLIIYLFLPKKVKQEHNFKELFGLLRKPWSTFIFVLAFYIACLQLTYPPGWHMAPPEKLGLRMVFERIAGVVMIISFTWILLRLTDFFGQILVQRAALTESKSDDQIVPFLRESIKVVIVILSIFFVLGAVFHINVVSLVAGLGIGGLAVALAAKESIENLFASFTIFLDKPFTVGDQVQVGTGISGTVERIGFRSTRLRTEEKSYVTVPNKKMVDSEVNNLSLRPRRRVKQTLTFNYNTPASKLHEVIGDITKLLTEHPTVDESESRVRLYEFSSSSLDILVIYFIKELEYDTFLTVKQDINFRILEIVEKRGVRFAFPSTSVYIEKN